VTDLEERCLEAFPNWLDSLGRDTPVLLRSAQVSARERDSRLVLATALNYLLKSVDLIPDGIEDLGFLDAAFACRVAASIALTKTALADGPLSQLANDATLIEEFLGDDFGRLSAYVLGLGEASVRGRTSAELLDDPTRFSELADELEAWSESYASPHFSRDEMNLVKLRSFFKARLR
jgi:uncharacterized membrane protein YkvA (DUF1232 family)